MNTSPQSIFDEYREGIRLKSSIGKHGLYEQARINERFFIGDQWYGAGCGSDRPLVRHNVIKRIGDFKMSHLTAGDRTVRYTAEGVPDTLAGRRAIRAEKKSLAGRNSAVYAPLTSENETGLVVEALSRYHAATAHRVGLAEILDRALRNAYISGTGAVYTYFDPELKTGLYADRVGGTAITGDIVCECIRIENIYFGDPTCENVQQQPYIILAERVRVGDLRREAIRRGLSEQAAARIKADDGTQAGKATVLTKLFKQKDENGETHVYCVKVCEGITVRPAWDIGVRLYPLSIFRWEQRENNVYGDSEITYLIPNQIAINRMITASVWSAMTTGMPLMVVNGDLVGEEITNDPGQIVRVFGDAEEIDSAVRFINPPDFSSGYNQSVTALIRNTLTQSGANDAALGDVNPDNTSAIIELREAASMALAMLKNRYDRFIEDIAMIWAEFFIGMYGKRCLKIVDENGVWYLPFDGSRYKELILSVAVEQREKIDNDTTQALFNLYEKGAITTVQYLSRLPEGLIPGKDTLIRELQEAAHERI